MDDITGQMASMLPSADTDTRSTNEYLGKSKDTFNPLEFAKESWEDAKKKFMDAGITETDANNPALYNAYLRSVDYLKDTGLAGLDLADAAARALIGTAGEIITGDDQTQKRFERDIYSMPDAFAGMAGTKNISQLDDAIESAVGTGIQAAEKAKDVGYAAYQKAPPVVGDIVGQTRAMLSGDKTFGTTSDVGPRPLSAFGGVGMEGASKDKNLKKAIALAQQAGVANKGPIPDDINGTIWAKTGWFVDPSDGQWRMHFSDYNSKMLPFKQVFKAEGVDFDTLKKYPLSREDGRKTVLSNVLSHDDLYKRYPEFKDTQVNFFSNPLDKTELGYANSEEIGINIAAFRSYDDMRQTILHEIQHFIQDKEGFAPGTNPGAIPGDILEGYQEALKKEVAPTLDKYNELRIRAAQTTDSNEKADLVKQIADLRAELEPYNRLSIDAPYNFYRGASGEIEARLVDEMSKSKRFSSGEIHPLSLREGLTQAEGLVPQTLGFRGVDPRIIDMQERRVPEMEEPKGIMQRIKGTLGLNQERSSIDRDTLLADAPQNAQEVLGITEDAKQAWRSSRPKRKQERTPQLQKGIEAYLQNEITYDEYLELADNFRPIVPIKEAPDLPTNMDIVSSLTPAQVNKGIIGVTKDIQDGTRVASRLDINAYENFDTWVVSLHDGAGDSLSGKSIGYGQVAVLENVNFKTEPKGAVNIAKGKGKATIARMFGDYKNADPEAVHQMAKDILADPNSGWVQVGMNPYRHSFFYDKADGMPVTEAAELIQVGPLVLARGVKKVSRDDPQFQFLMDKNDPESVKTYSEGGMAMNEQMNYMFKSTRGYAEGGEVDPMLMQEGIDPISGNEVPTGAMPEEVRDDIPAQLSEGEYVVPADVVRYYGVKFFEDLRNQAKMGWEEMNQNGRIGGEPVMQEANGMEMVEPEDDLPFDISELQTVEAAEGAYVSGFGYGGVTSLKDIDVTGGFTGGTNTQSPAQTGQTIVMYAHPDTPENTVALIFYNGEPSEQANYYIKMGYVPASEVKAKKEEAPAAQQQDSGDNDNLGQTAAAKQEKIDWNTASTDQYEKQLKMLESKWDNRGVQAVAGMINPVLGIAARIGMGSADRTKAYDMLDGIEAQLGSKNITDEVRSSLSKQKERLQKIVSTGDDGKSDDGLIGKSGIFGGKSSMYEGLTDTSGDGRVTFADTWLGDLLGLDGKVGVQAKDAQGNLLTLGASRSGGRRNTANAAVSPSPSSNTTTTPRSSRSNTNVSDTSSSNPPKPTNTNETTERTTRTNTTTNVSLRPRQRPSNTGAGIGAISNEFEVSGLNKGGLMTKKKK